MLARQAEIMDIDAANLSAIRRPAPRRAPSTLLGTVRLSNGRDPEATRRAAAYRARPATAGRHAVPLRGGLGGVLRRLGGGSGAACERSVSGFLAASMRAFAVAG